jgi:cytosine deaminase
MLLDDAGDPGLRTLEMMAVEAIKRGWQGRALAHHCRAMSLYPAPYVQRLARLLNTASVAVVTDPHTGPLHARVKELRAEGVRVCLGQDDISDAFYTFGRNNMLEVAFLAAHLLWMMTRQDVAALYDMITLEPAKAIREIWPLGRRARKPRGARSAGRGRGAPLSRPAGACDQPRQAA